MTDTTITDTQAVIDAAYAAAEATELDEGQDYAFVVPAGGTVEVVRNDLDQFRARPRRKTGTVTVRDAASFTGYVHKHGLPETEVWADPTRFALVAVINAHMGISGNGEGPAGWGDHRATLALTKTVAWQAWEKLNGQLLDQVAFAEHVEQRSIDIVDPPSADMLELAQTFTAKRNLDFESSKRLSSGQVQLGYREQTEAKAGTRGELEIPEKFTLGLAPFDGGNAYKITARLRYRILHAELRLGYVLDRPDDVLREAFDDLATHVDNGIDQDVWTGTP